MKKKSLIIAGIILVLVLCIGVGVYKLIEKDVTDRETFDFKTNANGSNDTVSHDEHSFFGKVIESHSSYIVVEPNEGERERKSSNKILVSFEKNNDEVYQVGSSVKITYDGRIKMSYPAKINATKIEIKSADNFEIIFNQEPGNVKRQIIDKNKDNQYNYNVYLYNGKVDIVIDKITYSLEKALKEEKITMDEIIAKANKDFPNVASYDDGGSMEYHYDNYTIIKFHTKAGNRDVYIGNKNLRLNDIN